MKRWAIIITLTYALLWLALAYPVTWFAVEFNWGFLEDGNSGEVTHQDFFSEPLFWGMLVVLVICQAALLLVPVGAATERPKARRGILLPILAITFLLANLVFWGVASLGILITNFETIFTPADFISVSIQQTVEQGLIARMTGVPLSVDRGWYELGSIGLLIGAVWLIWGGVFYRFYKQEGAEGMIRRWMRNLFRGSVLELLVALPTHIAIRSRGECCAPMVSFMGIVTGLSVMLMCFGPGILFLYLERARRLKPKQVAPAGQ